MENKEIEHFRLKYNPPNICLIIVATLILTSIISCAQAKTGYYKTTSKISELSQKFVRSLRDPGERQVLSPVQTAGNYECSRYKPYRLFIEKLEIVPSTVNKGDEFNQRVQYALCSSTNKNIQGTVKRVLRYKGSVIFSDRENYEYKPGTWAVDVFIEVPADASKGQYDFELTMYYGYKSITDKKTFYVE